MRIRRVGLSVLSVFVLPALLAAADEPWRDATRDIYIDGRLDRSAQLLSHAPTHRQAVVVRELEDALILDREAGTFTAVPRRAFRFEADRASAELLADVPARAGGSLQKVDSTASILAWEGRTVLVTRHQGLVGEISEETLFATVPVWKSLMDAYTPAAGDVAALRAIDGKTGLTLVFGTWCGDSKEFVPRVLKAVHAAANPRITIRLLALDGDFLRPAEVIQGRRIINVPTVIVEAAGRELGRITETPAAATMEADIAAIVAGRPNRHPGRYDRGPELARGTYMYRDAAGVGKGTERWTLYATKDGGRLLWSEIVAGDLVTEVFQGRQADGGLRFAEITRRRGDAVERARFFRDGDKLVARLRGREAGILEQEIVLPPDFAFASPAVAAAGWVGQDGGAASGQLTCYVAPESFDSPLGSTCLVSWRAAGEDRVRVPAGEFAARHVARQARGQTANWWLHTELGVPVRGETPGGLEYVLTDLTLPKS